MSQAPSPTGEAALRAAPLTKATSLQTDCRNAPPSSASGVPHDNSSHPMEETIPPGIYNPLVFVNVGRSGVMDR